VAGRASAVGKHDGATSPRRLARCSRGLGGELRAVQIRVQAVGGDQLLVRPALDDPALVDHQDHVCVAHGGQPVGDDQRRTPGERGRERDLDGMF
jgi:hypothetical protein